LGNKPDFLQISEISNADTTLRFGQEESPNACLLCHKNQSASWVKTQLVSWNREAGKGNGR